MRVLLRNLWGAPRKNIDLIVVFGVILCGVHLIPTDSIIARSDLAPWITVMVVIVAVLRANTLGDPPPPALTPRRWMLGRILTRAARVLSPITIFFAYDTGAQASIEMGWATLVGAMVGVALAYWGSSDGATAWSPHRGVSNAWWGVRILATLVAALLIGGLHWVFSATFAVWLPVSLFVGLQMHSVGLFEDRLQTRRQRRAAGRRDGRRYSPVRFRYLLAIVGPSSGLLLLLWLHEVLIGPVGFGQALVVSLHVLAWTAILFPRPAPIAVSCLLHEVVPSGGKDPGVKPGAALSFDTPPVGALRINPVWVRRLRVIHHWVVAVRDPRIEDLDDPIRPLWRRRPPPLSHHVLGNAVFEPDPVTQQPQWAEITVRLKDQIDVGQLHQFNAQQRRMVVLRPFSSVLDSLFRTGRTYRWDTSLPRGAMMVVDASTTQLSLRDGDILILSTEGVARAFELEIGVPVYDRAAFGHQRPPQLEDYVGVG